MVRLLNVMIVASELSAPTGVKPGCQPMAATGPFPCLELECDKSYQDKRSLIRHEKTHNDPKRHKCEVSGCKFSTRYRWTLKRHRASRHPYDELNETESTTTTTPSATSSSSLSSTSSTSSSSSSFSSSQAQPQAALPSGKPAQPSIQRPASYSDLPTHSACREGHPFTSPFVIS